MPVTTLTIDFFSPTSGGVGTVVTITGKGFDATTVPWFVDQYGNLTVMGTVQSWTGLQPNGEAYIYIVVPSGAHNGPIRLINGDNTWAQTATNYNVGPSPTITSFTPTWGPGGTTITINGTNFIAPLQFYMYNDNWGTITSYSSTQIIGTVGAVIPPYYTTQVVVKNAYSSVTSSQQYNYTTTTTAAPTTTTTTTTTLAPTLTMTLDYQQGGYYLSVTHPLGTALSFTNCNVLAYITSSSCSGGADDSASINGLTLPAGSTNANIIAGGLSCTDKKYKLAGSVTINGVQRFNNTTFAIGSQNVTLNILHTACSAYPC